MKKAIVVLGGGMRQDETGRWCTVGFREGGDKFGLTNDRFRVDAAYYLWREDKESIIIASGGKGQMKDTPNAPALSVIIKRELVELGVPETSVVEESESRSTYQQLLAVEKMLQEGFVGAVIISNNYHLKRINAMIHHAPGLQDLASNITLVGAEDILLDYNPGEWARVIKEAEESPEMWERIRLEEQGTEQIKNGTYRFG